MKRLKRFFALCWRCFKRFVLYLGLGLCIQLVLNYLYWVFCTKH